MDLEVARTLADLVSVDAMVTSNGDIIYANPRLDRRIKDEMGWKMVEGHHVCDLFEGIHQNQVREWYSELRARGDRFGILELRSVDAGPSDGSAKLIALRLEDRELIVFSSPEVRPVMEELRELETTVRMFRNYLRDGGLGLMILQDEGHREALIRYINRDGASILMREPGEMMDMEVAGFIAQEERDGAMTRYRTRMSGREVEANQEVRFVTPSGQDLLLDVVLGLTTWSDQPAVYLIFRDETDKMAMIQELRRFAQAFEILNDTVVLADRDFNTIYINPTGLMRSGYTHEEVLGKPASMFSTTEEGDLDPFELIQELYDKGYWQGERTAIAKDGRKYPVDLAVSMTKDDRGDPEMIAAVSRDISERKDAERIILMARERAEFFTDLMAHDINNYIQGVIGFLDLIMRGELDEAQQGQAARALEQAHRVSELIDRVRTISKAQHPAELKPVDLMAIIDEAVGDVGNNYQDRDVDIRVESPGGPVPVMADDLLNDLALNLLDNAVKFCDEDEVVVDVLVEHVVRGSSQHVLLSVADRGPGIPDEDKDSVFYRFVRKVEDDRGSGLGLSLVMALCDRYGGSVWVEDRVPGKPVEGSRFVVELPSA